MESNQIPTMAGSKYILLEFSPRREYQYIRTNLQRCLFAGYLPILAHVERYICLEQDISLVEELVNMGVYIQFNTNSIVGNIRGAKGSQNTYINLSTASMVATNLTRIFDSDILKTKIAMDIGESQEPANIMAEVIPETNIFVVTVSASSPEQAYRTIISIMDNYTSVTNHIFDNAIIDVLEAPSLPSYPSNYMDTDRVMKIALFVGGLITALLLGFASVRRDTIKNEQQIARKLDTKLFGLIYHERKYKTLRSWLRRRKKSILINSPMVSFSFVENFKKMRTKIEYKAERENIKVILVTSTLENEGKSTVAINLAMALAQKSENVLMVDGDLGNPSLHKILKKDIMAEQKTQLCSEGDPERKGELEEVLSFDIDSGLFLLYGSKLLKDSVDLAKTNTLADLIKVARGAMDYIIIDAPPVSVSADASILADLADASLLVIRQSMALAKDINDTIDLLSESKAKLIGCVYNNVYRSSFINRGVADFYKAYGHYNREFEKKIANS
ncbi:MAG: P-loop NTPase [Clostridiales bacterium]|nr:P-loop NTPase [Clostridiales bacterium]